MQTKQIEIICHKAFLIFFCVVCTNIGDILDLFHLMKTDSISLRIKAKSKTHLKICLFWCIKYCKLYKSIGTLCYFFSVLSTSFSIDVCFDKMYAILFFHITHWFLSCASHFFLGKLFVFSSIWLYTSLMLFHCFLYLFSLCVF